MNESNQQLSDEDFEEYKRVLDKISDGIQGEIIDHIVNGLCYVLGAVCADVEMDKKIILANIMQSISSSYDVHKAEYDKGEIKWLN